MAGTASTKGKSAARSGARSPARSRGAASAAQPRAAAVPDPAVDSRAALAQILDDASLPIVEALSEGVLIHDPRGAVMAFNARALELLGVSAERLGSATAEEPVVAFIREDGAPLAPAELPTAASLRSGERQSGVVLGVRLPEGSVRWLSVNSSVLSQDGKPYAAVASFIDITAFRQTAQQRDAERLKDVKRLALVAEYRDDDTNHHTERIARTSALVAMELGLERELIWTIGRAAPLHDVGKVAIPDSILLKPGKLTPEEFDVMKTHTTIGARLLSDSEFPVLRMGTEIALTHHERWDGGGYPAGLSGESIPISGRIVAVADAFDAMAHSRPYKQALPVPEAVAEINTRSGSQFDPTIVRAFLALDHYSLIEQS